MPVSNYLSVEMLVSLCIPLFLGMLPPHGSSTSDPEEKLEKKRFIDKPLNEGRVRFILSVSLFYLLVSFDDSKVSRNTGTRNNYVFNLPRYLLWFVIFETKKKCKGGFFRCNVLK